jgi:hypothetical protein
VTAKQRVTRVAAALGLASLAGCYNAMDMKAVIGCTEKLARAQSAKDSLEYRRMVFLLPTCQQWGDVIEGKQ